MTERHRENLLDGVDVLGGWMKEILFLVLFMVTAHAQQYPRWFLFPDRVKCPLKIVTVMRAPTLYRDSAVALAFRTGCDMLAKYTSVRVRGGQAFWTTEAGVHSMGSQYSASYDSSLNDLYQSTLKVLDAFVDHQKTIVLVGDSSLCLLDEGLTQPISVSAIQQPDWVERLPDDARNLYGVGSSEEYYYESSSWERAEQNTFMSLARTTRSTVISMQKKTTNESQDVFNEDIDVELHNVEIVARWRDIEKKIFYVLGKVKR